MNHLFEIDQATIKAVDDETARELVARLCKAELRGQGLPESVVMWGGDQRAKDGGVDVHVVCSKPLCSTDFVPTAHNDKIRLVVEAEKARFRKTIDAERERDKNAERFRDSSFE